MEVHEWNIRGVQALGTSFPLMFDDMAATTTKGFEDIVKSHWETEWSEQSAYPQIVFTSNHLNLRDWAKSRLKRVDFDVHFVPTTRTQEHLATILDKPNPLFRWFARKYLERTAQPGWLTDDEMGVARDAMLSLYEFAGRDVPQYFPGALSRSCMTRTYAPGRTLSASARPLSIGRARKQASLSAATCNPPRYREYRACLPQAVKLRRLGKTLVIENPSQFHDWLNGASAKSRWWVRILKR